MSGSDGGSDGDDTGDDALQLLVTHMTRTYCRMRGKDFVRKYMQRGFKNSNLGKGIRPTLAVISNPVVRKALAKSVNKTVAKSTVTNEKINEQVVDNDKDMHTMMEYTSQLLLDDEFISTDEGHLFQEELI